MSPKTGADRADVVEKAADVLPAEGAKATAVITCAATKRKAIITRLEDVIVIDIGSDR